MLNPNRTLQTLHPARCILNPKAPGNRRVLELSPDNVEALTSLGEVELQQGDVEASMGHWREALAMVPDDADTHYNFGCLAADAPSIPGCTSACLSLSLSLSLTLSLSLSL